MVTSKDCRNLVLALTGSIPERELTPDLRRLRIETLLLEAEEMVKDRITPPRGIEVLRGYLRQTHTYAILEVAPETYKDVRDRLEAAGVLQDYLWTGDKPEIIIFGGVALKAEEKPKQRPTDHLREIDGEGS
jgi:hypothetical protein